MKTLSEENITTEEQFKSAYPQEYELLTKHLRLYWIDAIRVCKAMREFSSLQNKELQEENERLRTMLTTLQKFSFEMLAYKGTRICRDNLRNASNEAAKLLNAKYNPPS